MSRLIVRPNDVETLQVALLKPGGRLVYSTCTINPEENECNVAYAPADKHMKVCVFITAVPITKLSAKVQNTRQQYRNRLVPLLHVHVDVKP
jgi:16S rRNA C967 or C1407 C5-methylase (RsmB/RsmF family)